MNIFKIVETSKDLKCYQEFNWSIMNHLLLSDAQSIQEASKNHSEAFVLFIFLTYKIIQFVQIINDLLA